MECSATGDAFFFADEPIHRGAEGDLALVDLGGRRDLEGEQDAIFVAVIGEDFNADQLGGWPLDGRGGETGR
jgi:hypothetical protein